MLSNRLYDILKWIVMVFIPAVSAFYFALSGVWSLPYTEQIVGTLAAVDAFLGTLLGIASVQYNKVKENEGDEIS